MFIKLRALGQVDSVKPSRTLLAKSPRTPITKVRYTEERIRMIRCGESKHGAIRDYYRSQATPVGFFNRYGARLHSRFEW